MVMMIHFKNEKDRQEILHALECNMNEEIRSTLQYICHRISSKGRDEVIGESFKTAALDEMTHILYFSDIITKYGGTPQFKEWQIDRSSELKKMLEADIQLEKSSTQRYKSQIDRFKEYPELVAILQSVLDDETDHEELFTRYLKELS
jgi:bacterioferritin (cytochrome b1)